MPVIWRITSKFQEEFVRAVRWAHSCLFCLLNCWPRKFGGNQIVGVYIPSGGKNFRICRWHYTLISSDTESLRCSLQIVEQFGSISGLKVNKKKMKAMWTGSSKTKNTKILEFRSTEVPIKILGAHLSYDVGKNDANFFCQNL